MDEPEQPLARLLVEKIDAHVRRPDNPDDYKNVAIRAGMSKQQLANLRAAVASNPEHVITSDVAERLASAIGHRVAVMKKRGSE